MSFSDDELKQLLSLLVNLEFVAKNPKMDSDWPGWIMRAREALALSRKSIARLEAAEKALTTGHYCHIESANTCEGCLAQKAWRKEAGK